MATKHTDTCLQNAADDEPIFVLRAQDKLASAAVRYWAARADSCGVPQAKVTEAFELSRKMDEWAKDHPTKVPD